MKKIYFITTGIVVIFLIVIDLTLFHRVKNAEIGIQLRDSIIKHNSSPSSLEIEYIQNSFSRILSYHDTPISNVKLTDTNLTKHTLDDVLCKGPVLILRYAETNCGSCVFFALEKIKEAAKKHQIIPVIMAEYSDLIPFKNAVSNFNTEQFPFYNVETLTTLDKELTPYYFILMPDHTMQAVFFPDKMFPQITDLYFEKVVERFLK